MVFPFERSIAYLEIRHIERTGRPSNLIAQVYLNAKQANCDGAHPAVVRLLISEVGNTKAGIIR